MPDRPEAIPPGEYERNPNDNKKNKKKNEQGWCTEDLYFDQEGRLFVPNKALALAIDVAMQGWGKRLVIMRDRYEDYDPEPEDDEDNGGVEGQKVNMMCPCAPEP